MTNDKKKMGRPPERVIPPLCNEATPAKVAAIVVRTKPKKRGGWQYEKDGDGNVGE